MSNLISYYVGLLTHQYANSPKFIEWLTACLGPFDDASTCIDGMVTDFDLDTAIGTQQDILGVLLGAVPRKVPFQPSGGVSPVLDDDTYRLVLRAKIFLNQWDGKIESAERVFGTLFPGAHLSITDNQNMTMTITSPEGLTSIEKDLMAHGYLVPRPQGVGVITNFSDVPYLGFDLDNSVEAGFDRGYFTP